MSPLVNSLKQTFGFDAFRDGQQQTIEQLLNGQSSLAIFPTGSGKSLCYQLAAIELPHLTIVVSPLLALMKDQLAFLETKGIAAASIDSTLTPVQNQQVMADTRSGKIKILMVSVERFKNERFRQFIDSVNVSMLVVDEAHCISEWGHNFRPDYLKLPNYRQELNIPLVLLLTATATKKVKKDMASKFDILPEHIVQTGFYRNNLDLTVLAVSSKDKNQQLLTNINAQTGCGIVYVTLQQSAEYVASFLSQQGLNAQPYHAGFISEKRQKIQEDFMSGKVQIIVATIAFGMGIDKADIRFVIHYDLPKSIENYSQEIGRAGRDGLASNCITLANLDGLNTVENFVFGDTPELSGIECVINNIQQECLNERWELQGLSLSNISNIRQLPMRTLLVQLELQGVIKPLFSYFADFKYKFTTNKDDVLNCFEGERKDFLATIFSYSGFKKVWGEPDFDALFQHYGCNRGRVIVALEYLQEKQLITLETKKITEVFSVNKRLLSAENLAKSLHDYFVDKEEKEIKRIATLVRFFELASCLSRNLSLYFNDKNTPEHCGHCSVCRGNFAKLSYSQRSTLPDDAVIVDMLTTLIEHMSTKHKGVLSLETMCRFLTGLTVPLFSRNKIKQLPGFGCCENIRYQEVREKVISVMKN
ncbi:MULTISPECIES: RecQ family ATP-dependent DNA helicase [unclassified Colwellia]|uniref:RecQ family ATP-dependent DNA helicase n=1 Tax=unclassified Colwellia TaxID=196834 RepID=UPI0015F70E02|nr:MULTISPECIES: RecQ family ATP-dependent DNA helicase [unclassified Colwellia]MBA6233289.1 RecQ family ATP-dependent DNA helicase [Colwellia sp. MB02u-7]MBA6236379.1 RecQ family ATP-dependent DNA helicase [Colwellia sp. MB02u-11]MBA6298221.1 RecQ family ATP-dependent DNA helicase [Colwellia sp. MB3u-22]MBA6311954.1 RecQ family ATP-dependent DNA helicase [Colwellia sp. MB3u-64]